MSLHLDLSIAHPTDPEAVFSSVTKLGMVRVPHSSVWGMHSAFLQANDDGPAVKAGHRKDMQRCKMYKINKIVKT